MEMRLMQLKLVALGSDELRRRHVASAVRLLVGLTLLAFAVGIA